MIELLRAAAAAQPRRTAVASSRGEVSYSELLGRANAACAGMRALGFDRVAILDDDPASVLTLLAGAAKAGVEACVYPLAATDDAVAEHRERFAHDTLITSRPSLWAQPGAVATADLLGDGHGTADVDHDDLVDPEGRQPVLVMTTGTSGVPKGVVHDWSRLLAPAQRIHPTPEHRWILAYGLNQFGGLQILIHVLAAQATLVVGDSFQPRHGLAAMRRWAVTHASGTPTFWRFLLAEAAADGAGLPELQQVTLSGEAVPEALLGQIQTAFPRAGISQIYAATEFGQGISIRDGRSGLPRAVLDAADGLQFKIVDDELYVRSSTAMLGYHGGERFDAEDWRATGDLVDVVDDRIEFRGRTTDVINVGGVKVHPLPIEERASKVEGVVLARAFGRPNAMVGQIVALEIVPDPLIAVNDHDELLDRVRASCADLPPAARPRSIKVVNTLGTTGNKMSRSGPR